MQKRTLMSILSAVMLLFGLHAHSQQTTSPKIESQQKVATVSGKVTETKTTYGVKGALISIPDLGKSTVVNAEGMYEILNVPFGNHLIEVHLAGFHNTSITINVTGNITKDFVLTEAVAECNEIIVTGNGQSLQSRTNPISVSVIRKNTLLSTNGANLIDALAQQVKGLTTYSTGPAINKPIIRGLGYNRIVVVNDGVRQEGQQWGDEHGIEIDEYATERVEVLRGAASLAYGSDALGGVINASSYAPVATGVVKGNIMYHGMQNNGQNGFYADLQGNENGIHYGIKVGGRKAGDYSNKLDGNVLNSRFNERNVGLYAGLQKKWGNITFYGANFDQQLGIITGDRDDQGNFLLYKGSGFDKLPTTDEVKSKSILTPYQKVFHTKLGIDNLLYLGKARLHVNMGYQNNIRSEHGNPVAANIPDIKMDLQTYTINAALQFAEMKGWRNTLGITGMNQEGGNRGIERIIPNYDLRDGGVYFISNKTFGKYTFSGGARYDARAIKAANIVTNARDFKKDFNNVSASAGLTFQANDMLTYKINVARGFRAPNLAELGSNGIHEGTNRYEYGNKQLKSETSLQVDAGIEVQSEHLSMSVTPFYNRINNYIFYSGLQTAAGVDSTVQVDGEEVRAYTFSQNNPAIIRGFEFSVDIHPHPIDWLHFENTISFVRGRFGNAPSTTINNDAYNVPFMPAARWLSELRAQFVKAGANMRNAYIKLQMDRTGDQEETFGLYNTETFTKGYTLWNIGIGTELHFNDKHFVTVHAGVLNASNVAYQSHLSRLKYTDYNSSNNTNGVFNMGENYYVKVNFPINIKPRHKKIEAPMIPLDTDGDGIIDAVDKCITIPGLAKYNGCTMPDRDNDGIADEEDNCPDVFGTAASKGCPEVADKDKDGIADSEDNCPDVFGVVANKGCPEEVIKPKDDDIKKVALAAKNINFETSSSTLLASSNASLNEVIEVLKANPNYIISVEGHTDSKGDEAKNQALSEKRAKIAAAYIIKKGGIDASRISTAGYGSTQPLDTNDTPKGRANNRRVMFTLK